MKVISFAVDFDDRSLDGAADAVETAINQKIDDLLTGTEGPRADEIVSVQIIPTATSYATPIPGSYRDDISTERGLIIVIGYKEPKQFRSSLEYD